MIRPHRWIGYSRAHWPFSLNAAGIRAKFVCWFLWGFLFSKECVWGGVIIKTIRVERKWETIFPCSLPRTFPTCLVPATITGTPAVPVTWTGWWGGKGRAGQNNLSSLGTQAAGVGRLCVCVAGKAQESCGFEGKPARGVWELQCQCRKNSGGDRAG